MGRHCATEYSLAVHNEELLNGCPDCDESPFGLETHAGLVYIVKNPNQTGVKNGMTERTIEARLNSLNTSSVPGRFEDVAIFASD